MSLPESLDPLWGDVALRASTVPAALVRSMFMGRKLMGRSGNTRTPCFTTVNQSTPCPPFLRWFTQALGDNTHGLSDRGFLAANHPAVWVNQNVAIHFLSKKTCTVAAMFPHRLKHSNGTKDWSSLIKLSELFTDDDRSNVTK